MGKPGNGVAQDNLSHVMDPKKLAPSIWHGREADGASPSAVLPQDGMEIEMQETESKKEVCYRKGG